MVAPKGNKWGTNYWLAHSLEGKKTLNFSLTEIEGIDFPIGSMVTKGEYFTLDERMRKKQRYVFEDYRSSHFVSHYANLVAGTNLQL